MRTFYLKIYHKDSHLYYSQVYETINSLIPIPIVVETQYNDHVGIRITFNSDSEYLKFSENIQKKMNFTLTAGD